MKRLSSTAAAVTVAALAVSFALGTVSSCSDADSVVLVNVRAGAGVPAVFQLRATLSNGGVSDVPSFPAAARTAAIDFPTAFSLTFARAHTGSLDIALDALGAGGVVVANGAASAVINPGNEATVTITLAAGASTCGNGQIDPGEECDDGDRITNGTCDFMCHRRILAGAGGAPGTGGALGTGGAFGTGGAPGTGGIAIGVGGAPGTGGVTLGTGGVTIGTGGRGTGGAGTGGVTIGTGGAGTGGVTIGTGGRGTGGAGAGGGAGCRGELLTNGTFDLGNVDWTATSPDGSPIIFAGSDSGLGSVHPQSPDYLAWLGRNLGNGDEILSQPIQVPAGATTITLLGFVRIAPMVATLCLGCVPPVEVEIQSGAAVTVIKTWTSADATDTWIAFSTTVDGTLFHGSPTLFRFHLTNGLASAYNVYFDSVSFQANCN